MKQNSRNEALINFGVLLRKLRLQRGYKSAETFSYEYDLNRTAYWRWENGENITMKNFFRLCDIHQKTPKEIFELIEYNPKLIAQNHFYLNEPNENNG